MTRFKKILEIREIFKLPSECSEIQLQIPEEAQVTLIDERKTNNIEHRHVELHVGTRAHVKWISYQNHALTHPWKDQKKIILNRQARLGYFHHVLGGEETQDDLQVELHGDESEAFTQTLFFGRDHQRQNIHVTHVHHGKNTRSRMISKGAVKDEAKSGFYGMIHMMPGCSGSESHLEEHNLLLNSGAKIDALPGLEIRHHDVQVSHAATMEKIDEEKLFYLLSRGIPQKEAFELILEGFFKGALAEMKDNSWERRIFKDLLQWM